MLSQNREVISLITTSIDWHKRLHPIEELCGYSGQTESHSLELNLG